MAHRRPRQGHRHRLDDVAVNMLAVAWLARGMWRVRQGRLPWQPPRRRR